MVFADDIIDHMTLVVHKVLKNLLNFIVLEHFYLSTLARFFQNSLNVFGIIDSVNFGF